MRESRSRGRKKTSLLAAAGLLTLLPVAACSNAEENKPTGAQAVVNSGDPLDLRGACPQTIVVQTPWFPQSELGELFHLFGTEYEIDAEKKRVSGPLVAQGKDTGVKLEVRAGGPAAGYEPMSSLMYSDTNITLGMPPLDEMAQQSSKQPSIGVVAPLDLDPLAIGWDPQEHPEFNTIGDIGQTDTKVLMFEGSTLTEYLVGSGILRRSQIDESYDGSPSRYVAEQGRITLNLFATNEPHTFEKEVKSWGRPVKFQLVNDTGYPNYRNLLAIRKNDKGRLAPCLAKLVPIIQQAQVDFMNKPDETIKLILKLTEAYQGGFVYSQSNAEFSHQQMKSLGIVGNGKDETIGNFEEERVQRMIDIVKPIFSSKKMQFKEDMKPQDLVTNEFIDQKVGL